MVWNMAGDYVINLMLENQGLATPQGGLINKKYEGWSTEQVYDYLIDNPDEQPQGGGEGTPSWDFGGVMDAKGKDGKPLQGEAKAAAEGKMKAKIRNAYNAAKKAGKLPAGLEDLIEDVCVPKASWQSILQEFISEKALTDYNWGTVNTRMLQQYGVITPDLDGYRLGELAIINDTSGSVSNDLLAQAAGEINDVVENYQCKITVVHCDTEVNLIEEFEDGDPIRLKCVGRGGTMQKPGYDWVAENIPNACAIIHFTDSEVFDWKDIEEPECPVLMACYQQNVASDVPDWIGTIVDIS